MYIPKNLELKDPAVIANLIAQNSFAVLVSADLTATHLPFVYQPVDGELGCLFGHFAKANSHWHSAQNQRVLVIFQGPHAYISPAWYATTPAVPTWNYAAVHCYGVLELLNDEDNQQAMQQLIAKYEPQLLHNADIMPADYQAKLRTGVVGFKIVLTEIQAKEKLGQQRKPEDQLGVFAALQRSDNVDANQLAQYMSHRNLGTGNE